MRISVRRIRDEKTGVSAGVDTNGFLYFDTGVSRYIKENTRKNKKFIERDFYRFTGKWMKL